MAIIREGEVFFTFTQEGDWWQVELASGKSGYMHRSRIKLQR